MKITFEGEDLQHVVARIGDFLNHLTQHEKTDLTADTNEKKPEPTRRKRRAKTSNAVAETTAEEGPRSQGADDPPTTRRRRAQSTAASASEDAKGRTRSRRSSG